MGKINRNYFWAQVLVESFVRSGLKYAVVSPGSRNTPLVLAFADHSDVKVFVNPDERSAAFFAAGIALKTREPVAVVTTSGTAVVELYPAVIEAYYQKLPLIICTADRPPDSLNTGTNQTINQKNIFRNNIKNFYDISLPDLSVKKLNQLCDFASQAITEAVGIRRGPVQINLPFKKPLEPFTITDGIETSLMDRYLQKNDFEPRLNGRRKDDVKSFEIREIKKKIMQTGNGVIICGPGNFTDNFRELCLKLSKFSGYPILADAASPLRYGSDGKNNVIVNYDYFLHEFSLRKNFDDKFLIQFGKAPITKSLLNFYRTSQAEKLIINEYGDLEDPSKTTTRIIKTAPQRFLEILLEGEESENIGDWAERFKSIDGIVEKLKKKHLKNADPNFEGKAVEAVLEGLPDECNLFIGNSSPVRYANYYFPTTDKKINVFTNRGASGIDGMLSTATGIAAESKLPTYALIGDLSFFHDLNGLAAAKKYAGNFNIILIDNDGGGIFDMLPINALENGFEEYFKAAVDMKFKDAVSAFGCKFIIAKDAGDLKVKLSKSGRNRIPAVYYIKTDSNSSAKYWNDFQEKVQEELNKYSDDHAE